MISQSPSFTVLFISLSEGQLASWWADIIELIDWHSEAALSIYCRLPLFIRCQLSDTDASWHCWYCQLIFSWLRLRLPILGHKAIIGIDMIILYADTMSHDISPEPPYCMLILISLLMYCWYSQLPLYITPLFFWCHDFCHWLYIAIVIINIISYILLYYYSISFVIFTFILRYSFPVISLSFHYIIIINNIIIVISCIDNIR